MLAVEAAIGEVRRRCTDHWLQWAVGQGHWPMRLKLGAPSGAWFSANIIETTTWAGTWRSAFESGRIPGVIISETRRARGLGTHELPTTWVIDDAAAALSIADPNVVASYQRAVVRLSQTAAMPEIIWDAVEEIPFRIARLIANLEEFDWCNTLAVVGHLVRVGHGGATVLRQLAIPGVHSKWIEKHAVLVGAMLGVPADARIGDPVSRLITHIGLLAKQTPLYVTLACPQLRRRAGELHRFQATIPVLNDTTLTPNTVLIVENAAPIQALDADLHGVAVVGGLGAGAPILAELNWIDAADRILYWGDIDRAGLAILASVRRAGIPLSSILMDEATLDAHLSGWHTASTQVSNDYVPAELDADEVTLYERLTRYHNEHGRELQLEQEHISNQLAYHVIGTQAESFD